MTMGDGGGHDPDASPDSKKTIPSFPCFEGPGGGGAARGIHVPAEHAPQVSDPSGYVVMGRVLLAAAGAFSGIFLALVFLRLYYASRRRHAHGGRGRRLLRSLAITDEDGGSRDGGAAPSPRGLDPAVLRALPVAAAGTGAGDCAVCLAELEPDDKARALSRCGHRFHVECIDAWFRGNATCPLCRADVVVVAPDAAAGAAGAEASAPPEVRIDVPGVEAAAAKGTTAAPAMGRLPSGTDLDKTRRVFASIRSASF